MNHKHLLPFIALIIAASIWGINNSVMKITLLTVPVFSLAFIRFGAASLILLPFLRNRLVIRREDLFRVVLSAICGVTLNITFFFFGIRLTSALNAGIIIASMPLFTLLFARVFLKEKITIPLVVGGLLGFVGIGIIIGKDLSQNGFSLSPVGDLLILASTLLFVTYEIINKKLFQTYNAFTISFYSAFIGAITFLPFAALETIWNPSWRDNVPQEAIIGILYGIFLSSLTAYSLWQWGLSKIPASRVGFFFYLDPVVSTIGAIIILHEVITVSFIVGAMLIFVGLFLAEGRLPYHHLHKHIKRI